jgi:hypothetical protein
VQGDLWTYRETVVLRGGDITGFAVRATDGDIGKVDEATEEAGRNWIVVDTGPWIFGKKVMLPAGTIESIDFDARTVFVGRTKDEIRAAPEFDPSVSREPAYQEELQTYYGTWYG